MSGRADTKGTVPDSLSDLARKYRLSEQIVDIEGRKLLVWSTTGIDDVLTDETDPDEIPYWAELWPSAVALSRSLIRSGNMKGKQVLELGCGTALPSIAAALQGASVTATDYSEDALEFSLANAQLNGAKDLCFRLVDWRHFRDIGRFDLVVGADILYERKLHQPLRNVLENTLKPGGKVVLADPCRPWAIDFAAVLEDTGWHVELSEETTPGMSQEAVILYTFVPPQLP